jgi:hypothetical protein
MSETGDVRQQAGVSAAAKLQARFHRGTALHQQGDGKSTEALNGQRHLPEYEYFR